MSGNEGGSSITHGSTDNVSAEQQRQQGDEEPNEVQQAPQELPIDPVPQPGNQPQLDQDHLMQS